MSDIFLLIKEMLAYILCTALAVLPILIYFRNPYFLKDLYCTFISIYVGIRLSRIEKRFYSILDRFLDKVAEHPHKKFIVYEESSYTYSQADRESNKVARALLTHAHLKQGDTVALFLGNEPWFVWMWLALSKLGCTASFLNVNIRSKSLLHCFSCCEAKVLIAGADLQGAIEEVLPTLKQQGILVFILREHCHVDGIESLSDKIQMESDEPLSRQLRASINIKSPAVGVYEGMSMYGKIG
uniref:Long-chain-fatty-acid--CoA ligase n=1 Tax=Maylandia zebra TaxID=106582 RepID=A0A3P9BGP5_9CICH